MPLSKIKFIAFIVGQFASIFILPKEAIFIMFTFIPSLQIVINIIHKQKHRISWQYLCLYVCHIINIFYILGFPTNNRGQKVNSHICGAIIIFSGLQIVILILQQKIGPYLNFDKLLISLKEAKVVKLAK